MSTDKYEVNFNHNKLNNYLIGSKSNDDHESFTVFQKQQEQQQKYQEQQQNEKHQHQQQQQQQQQQNLQQSDQSNASDKENNKDLQFESWRRERSSRHKHSGVSEEDAVFYERHLNMRIKEEKLYHHQRFLNHNDLDVPPTAGYPGHVRKRVRRCKHTCMRITMLIAIVCLTIFVQDIISGLRFMKSLSGVLDLGGFSRFAYVENLPALVTIHDGADIWSRRERTILKFTGNSYNDHSDEFELPSDREKKELQLKQNVLSLLHYNYNQSSPIEIHPNHHTNIAAIIYRYANKTKKKVSYIEQANDPSELLMDFNDTTWNYITLFMTAILIYLLAGPKSHFFVSLAMTSRRVTYIAIVLTAPGTCVTVLRKCRNARTVLRDAFQASSLTEFIYGRDEQPTRHRHRRYLNFLLRTER